MPPSTFIPPTTLVSIVDWSIQGAFVLLVFAHPWFLRLGQGWRAFGRPFLVGFLWGIWRMAYFDPTTHNDIPGIGYFVAAFGYGIIAYVLYAIRCAFLRRRATKSNATGSAS